MQYYVNISDHADACLYGPFATRTLAEGWAKEYALDFFGRHIHVISTEDFFSPVR